jgi:hypothetical protein
MRERETTFDNAFIDNYMPNLKIACYGFNMSTLATPALARISRITSKL